MLNAYVCAICHVANVVFDIDTAAAVVANDGGIEGAAAAVVAGDAAVAACAYSVMMIVA